MIFNEIVFTLFVVVLINFFLSFNNFKIGKYLGILDKPDGKRKIHKNEIPLTGGVFLFINIVIYYLFLIYNFKFLTLQNFLIFKNIYELNIFFLISTLIFMLGFLDDKFNLSANIKLFFLIIIFLSLITADKFIIMNEIRISFLSFNFEIGYVSFFWTLICFLLFINAINMFDGFNLQLGTYSLFFLIFLFSKGLDIYLFFIMFIFLIFYLFQNYKNKCFFGDSGTYLISFIFSYNCIKLYNNQIVSFSDEIVIAMLIPGLDLVRLFFFRISKKKHPFTPDRQHLHHYILYHESEKKTLFILMSCIFIPVFISQFFEIFLEMIFIQVFLYLLLLFKYNK